MTSLGTAGSMVRSRPALPVEELAALLSRAWGIEGDLRALPSERDQNLRVDVDGRPAYVMKVANPDEEAAFLDAQDAALERLGAAGLPVARLVPAHDGPVAVAVHERPARVRVVTWLYGTPVAAVERPPASLPEELGALMGRVTAALEGFDHPGANRPFQWDVLRAPETLARGLRAVADPGRHALLAGAAERLRRTAGRWDVLRRSVIHNDANDHNVLVDGAGRISGLLDLGDMVRSATAAEPAVAAAYLLDGARPSATIDAVTRGFERAFPLAAGDRDAIPELVLGRVAVSVAISAHQAALSRDAYLRISEDSMWRRLEALVG